MKKKTDEQIQGEILLAIDKRLDNIEAFVHLQAEIESMLKCVRRFTLEIETPIGDLLFEGEYFTVPAPHYEIFCPELRDLGVSEGETFRASLLVLKRQLESKKLSWWEKRRSKEA